MELYSKKTNFNLIFPKFSIVGGAPHPPPMIIFTHYDFWKGRIKKIGSKYSYFTSYRPLKGVFFSSLPFWGRNWGYNKYYPFLGFQLNNTSDTHLYPYSPWVRGGLPPPPCGEFWHAFLIGQISQKNIGTTRFY